MSWHLRNLRVDDIPGLLEVQRACYGDDFIEDEAVFARRIASASNCSVVLQHDDGVCAYLAAYRSRVGQVTPLHGDFAAPEQAPDTLYLHDMAVLPAFAGQGLARMLVDMLWRMARAQGLAHSALVSVQGSQPYWERKGYAIHVLDDAQQRSSLATYGDGAVYMLAQIGR